MCPLRFFLIFFSAIIAMFAAYQMTMEEAPEEAPEESKDTDSTSQDQEQAESAAEDEGEESVERKLVKGAKVVAFTTWDWASGMYLWRWFKKQMGWTSCPPRQHDTDNTGAHVEPVAKKIGPSLASKQDSDETVSVLRPRKQRMSPLADGS